MYKYFGYEDNVLYLIYVSEKKNSGHSNRWHWKDDVNNYSSETLTGFYIILQNIGKKEFCLSCLQVFCDKRILDTNREVCVTMSDFQSM